MNLCVPSSRRETRERERPALPRQGEELTGFVLMLLKFAGDAPAPVDA